MARKIDKTKQMYYNVIQKGSVYYGRIIKIK